MQHTPNSTHSHKSTHSQSAESGKQTHESWPSYLISGMQPTIASQMYKVIILNIYKHAMFYSKAKDKWNFNFICLQLNLAYFALNSMPKHKCTIPLLRLHSNEQQIIIYHLLGRSGMVGFE